MYALRERRVHVTQEDFEMAVTKVGFSLNRIFLLILLVWQQYMLKCVQDSLIMLWICVYFLGHAKGF